MIEQNELKHALMFTQRVAQLSKALWKSIEKDWQNWIKPYDLNINEHHILWIAYHLKGASISEIAKFGVMHVSTAFNFSKKLEERGYIEFSKKENDKRNTYIQLTKAGEDIFLELMSTFTGIENSVYQGAKPLKSLYGKFPELLELNAIVKQIYGDEFMEIFQRSLDNLDEEFTEETGKLIRKSSSKETVAH